MKIPPPLPTALLLAVVVGPLALAADRNHGHDHANEAKHEQADHDDHGHGPSGGEIIRSEAGFAFEIRVDQDRRARVVFLDRENKAVALGTRTISGIAGERSAPTRLTFKRGTGAEADTLISDQPLPAGDHVPLILTIKTAPEAKAVTERFELHLH